MAKLPRLRPLRRGARVPLADRDAAPPRDAPPDEEIEDRFETLHERLEELQRVFHADGRYALLIVLQGRDASGKDGTIRHVCGAFDPQGCHVTSFRAPTADELAHDFLWRIHAAVPPRGVIGVFNRSHYEDVLAVRVHGLVPRQAWSVRYDRINEFERTLAQSGVIIRKFFLHISRDEQRRRLLDRIEDPKKNWKFRSGDLDDRAKWNQYTSAYRDALSRCSLPAAPWYVVPADDKKLRNYLVARELVRTLEGLGLRYPRPDPAVRRYAKLLA